MIGYAETDEQIQVVMRQLDDEFSDLLREPVPGEGEITLGRIVGATLKIGRYSPDNFTKILSKANNFLRLGLFPGKNKGRGVPALFSEREALILYIALNLGAISPSHLVKILHERTETLHKTAEAGTILVFRPICAMAHLSNKPNRRTLGMMVLNVGQMRKELLDALRT
jgi:hypothetical protein